MPKAHLEIPSLAAGYVDVTGKALTLRSNVAGLLESWTSDEVDEAAWIFALDGWQQPLALGREYDRAYAAYLQFLKAAGTPGPSSAYYSLDSLRHILEELRNRVQFIQSRAADIRLSNHFSRLLDVTGERVLPAVDSLLERLATLDPDSRPAALDDFAERHGSLLTAFANAVGRRSGAAGAVVLLAEPYFVQAKRVLAELDRLGVAGNAIYDAIKLIVSTGAVHLVASGSA